VLAKWADIGLLVVIILLLICIVSYQLKVDNLYERLRISNSIIYCYEHPNHKGIKRHLRKDGEVR